MSNVVVTAIAIHIISSSCDHYTFALSRAEFPDADSVANHLRDACIEEPRYWDQVHIDVRMCWTDGTAGTALNQSALAFSRAIEDRVNALRDQDD